MSEKAPYPVQIFWSDEDDGYIALVPDLPGCSAFGETAEEALRESNNAIEAWLQAAGAAGNPIPKPSQPPLHKKYSGKILVRIPQTLHGQLAKDAEGEGVSLNQYIVYLLAGRSALRQAFVRYAHGGTNISIVTGVYGGFATAISGPIEESSPSGQVFPVWANKCGTVEGSWFEGAGMRPQIYPVSVNSDAMQRATNG